MSVATLNNFFIRFRNYSKNHLSNSIEKDLISFDTHLSIYRQHSARLSELLRSSAPSYNVFNILRIKRYETIVHTPFLKHLLDPEESHLQDRLFFDSFMELILGNRYEREYVTAISVFEEFPSSEGRMDILILYKQRGIKKALIIENKIGAPDREKQLKRYNDFLEKQLTLSKENYHLVYLKPYKSVPSEYSLPYNLYLQASLNACITEICYTEEVVEWLESIKDKINTPIVYYTLNQYIKTIKTF